jgi:hypothetical protein
MGLGSREPAVASEAVDLMRGPAFAGNVPSALSALAADYGWRSTIEWSAKESPCCSAV